MIIPDIEDSESLRQGVAQPTSKVAQLETETNVESRLSDLYSKIENLKIFFKNKNKSGAQSTKKVKNKAPESGFEPESEPRQFRI